MTHAHVLRLRRRARSLRQAGMTLTEIMIVVIIMAMIAAAVGIAVIPKYRDAQKRQARTDAATIRSAVEGFMLVNSGEPCPDVNKLVEAGELNRNGNLKDPWGHEFKIECSGEDIVVSSGGPDGQFGGDDDVR